MPRSRQEKATAGEKADRVGGGGGDDAIEIMTMVFLLQSLCPAAHCGSGQSMCQFLKLVPAMKLQSNSWPKEEGGGDAPKEPGDLTNELKQMEQLSATSHPRAPASGRKAMAEVAVVSVVVALVAAFVRFCTVPVGEGREHLDSIKDR